MVLGILTGLSSIFLPKSFSRMNTTRASRSIKLVGVDFIKQPGGASRYLDMVQIGTSSGLTAFHSRGKMCWVISQHLVCIQAFLPQREISKGHECLTKVQSMLHTRAIQSSAPKKIFLERNSGSEVTHQENA